MLHPVILSGGSGTRLWPLSRTALPKQMLPLASENSLLQDTLLRLRGLPGLVAPIIICNQEHRFLIAEQLREIAMPPLALMLEPAGRNTAPAVAVAALQLLAHLAERAASRGDSQSQEDDDLMLVLPSDHVITNEAAFHEAVAQAVRLAGQGYLTTFGIVPRGPETGYGYIRRGAPIAGETGAFAVAQFVEKPDLATAQGYIAAGDCYWNSGMFLMSARRYLDELERFAPDILVACRESVETAYRDLDFCRLGEPPFKACPADSIDYAVMEKTAHAAVVPADMGWSDVGSWSALWEIHPKDERGNATRGEVILHNADNCYVNAEKRLVVGIGIEDLVIAETVDALLVLRKGHDQDVKTVVERLQKEGRTEHELHRKVYRPWGSYEGVDRGDRFQVKRLIVKPGEMSSMQKHHHRSEHWIVVSGTAEVTCGDEVRLVAENESIYIPLGVSHRIRNPGRIPLHFIEVQSGPYLGEDDIVRTEDSYGRVAG